MSRRPARCTEADIRRAVKVADGRMAVDILPDGTIRLIPIEALPAKQQPLGEDREIVL